MKKYFLTLVIMVSALYVNAQESFQPSNYRWNIEPGYYYSFGASNIDGFTDSDMGGGFSLEARYRLNSGIELGAYVSMSDFDRTYLATEFNGVKIYAKRDFMSVNVLATATYNYRTSRYVELFGSMGMGWMYGEHGNDAAVNDNSCNSLVVMPRVGVKLRNHLKFSVGYKIQGKANSYAFTSVGWTFGIKGINE